MKPKQCPKCGSENIKEIVYGLPTEEFMESEEAKKYHFAGCIVMEDDPAWHCDKCGNDWGRNSE